MAVRKKPANPPSTPTRTATKKPATKSASARETRGRGDELHQLVGGTHQTLTTNQGIPIADNQNSLRATPRGPTLLEDFVLREKITHFDHERIPERIVHARGSAAHGYFELTRSLAKYTTAKLFTDVGAAHAGVHPFLHRRRRPRLGRHPARRARLRGEVLHPGRQLRPGRQQHPGVLHPGRHEVSRSRALGEDGTRPRLPAGRPARTTPSGTSSRSRPKRCT